MAVKQLIVQESINPNIIPMIDIMFLILLFFMLSADMGQRELEEVRLPLADAVKEDLRPDDPKAWPLTVNCFHLYERDVDCPSYKKGEICVNETHWRIGIKGRDYEGEALKDFLKAEADLDRRDPNNPTISERRVQIRADQSAVYGIVQKVMNTCAEVGIYKIEIGAAAKME